MDDDGGQDSSLEKRKTHIDADEVFVLMRKNTRVSRNIRACWFFRHLKSTISFSPLQELCLEELSQDLTLASLIPAAGEPMLDANQSYSVGINPHTTVTFLASRYRITFTLDLSPSAISVDVAKGQLVSEEIFHNFCKCLRALVKPFCLPGSQLLFLPKLFITVIAHTPVIFSAANQVLIQGVSVNQDNVEQILQYCQEKLCSLENQLSDSFANLLEQLSTRTDTFFVDEEEEEDDRRASLMKLSDEILHSHELAFVGMLRCGMLALQLLPENSSSVLVVITDGVVGVPEANLLELLLTQLRSSTISCSFLKVGSARSIQRQIGHVPNFELMQFIATATFGGYFLSCPEVDEDESYAPNVYHQAMYYWSFQKGLEGFCYDGSQDDPDVIGSPSWVHRCLYSHPLHGNSFGLEVLRKKHQERTVQAGLSHVLSVRLREGYTIKDVRFLKGGSEIEVKLVLPWRENGKVEYNATAAWPLEKHMTTKVEIFVEGSYDFLHELTCRTGRKIPSPFRSAHIKKFWQLLQNISQTDKLLVHLQSFETNPVNHEIPEYIRSGIPLFVLDPVNPVFNSQLSSQETQLAQFQTFWKPVIMLDTNIWQKWVHSHRIGLVLEQDLPLPRYLHVPNSVGRFNILQCRQALVSLTQLLRHWATIVLAENHSYIKFLAKDTDKPPSFFCLLRVTSKPPYVVLRLAFLGGTPSHKRREEIQALTLQLSELRFPQRYTQKSDKKPALKVATDNGQDKIRKAPLLREWSEINCCTVLRKPVEKILIRYEQKPEDLFMFEDRPRLSPGEGVGEGVQCGALKQPLSSKFSTLAHYLIPYRWMWCVPLKLPTVGKILQTLTKIRLQEGFHFASANSGITNMVLEVDMMDNRFTPSAGSEKTESDDEHQSCVIQYVVFPPQNKMSRDSVSEEDMDAMETTEGEGEVVIITECWVEPQFGVCINNTPERLHFEGLTCVELVRAFFDVDFECISRLTTFNHLLYLCQHADETPTLGTDIAQSSTSSPPSTPCHRHGAGQVEEEDRRTLFDLLTLLPCSQQAELLFSTFVVGTGKSSEQEAGVDPKGSNELLFSLLFEKLRAIHDREHFLLTEVAATFLDKLCNRSRDQTQHPFPFQYRTTAKTQREKQTSGRSSSRHNVDKVQQATISSTNTSQIPQMSDSSDKTAKIPKGSKNTARMSNHSASASSMGNGRFTQNGSLHGQPMWKCYIKAVSSTHMLLTFIPASYDDLLLLNEQQEENEGISGEEERKVGDCDTVASPKAQTSDSFGDTTTEPESGSGVVVPLSFTANEDTDSCYTGHTSGGRRGSEVLSGAENVSTTLITVTEPSPCQSPERTVAQSRQDDVKEWVNTSCPAAVPPAKGPMVIPIYVYDCHLHSITESLVNRWTFTLPPDLYEDMTFTVEGDENQPSPSTRERLASFDKEASVVEEKEEPEFSRPSWRSSLDRKSMDGMKEGAGDFKQHCHLITESFFNCFVTGLYQSLRHNYFVHHHDMDAVITSICQETLPLEVDMTYFLLSSCGHLQKLVSQARKEFTASMEADLIGKHSVRFMEVVDIQSDDGEEVILPEILQFPRRMIPLLPSLFSDTKCEHAPGLHKLLQEKFHDIVQRWFQQVDSMPDYFYFSPEAQQRTSRCEDFDKKDARDSTDEKNDDNVMETDTSAKDEDDGDIVMTDFAQHGPMDLRYRDNSAHVSVESNLDISMSDLDLSNVHTMEQEMLPFFVHFTCTLKRRTEHHNTSVTVIPQCLGDLLRTMKEPLLAIDFGEFKVTLDINCLTMPADQDTDPNSSRKPNLLRSMSNQSQGSYGRLSEGDADDSHSTAPSSVSDVEGPLDHLPYTQKKAIMDFKHEVEWLLNDEVASALRHMYPISSDAVEFVTQHVRISSHLNYPSVRHKKVQLQFVYGPDRSMKPFKEEFERMSQPGYHLAKVRSFYIFTVDRAHANNLLHAQALKSALVELSHEKGSVSSPVAAESNKLFPTMEERSHSWPNILDAPVPSDEVPAPAVLELAARGAGIGDENRPRSSSHDRVYKDSTLEDIRLKRMSVQSMLSKKEVHDDISDASLRKSHSFAGLQGQVTFTSATNVSPETHSGFLSSVKASSSSLIGNRSRHFSAPSGQGTPQSRASTLPQTPSVESSHGSGTSDGFEGDVSDENMDDTASISDAGLGFPQLPNFWLIMTIQNDCVELFFHAREREEVPDVQKEQLVLVSRTIQCIRDICCKVNKQLLLKELLETQMCNMLLVPEADEDVHWTDRRTILGRAAPDVFEGDDEDENEENESRGYLAAAMNFEPGYFACDCMWKKLFFLHPRLKTGSQRQGISRGLASLRSILNKFSVGNRKNMFVIKETSSGNVFYLKLRELSAMSLNEPLDIQADLESSMSELSLSSQMPAMKTVESKLEMERMPNNYINEIYWQKTRSEGDAASLASGYSRLSSRIEDTIELTVHGIEEPGKEIREDLMKVLQNKLDDTVLDVISVMLGRNPQCKLKLEDVQFIQSPEQDATETLQLTIPSHAMLYLSALLYYLRQNLLQFLHTPNFHDDSLDCHFQDKIGGCWQPILDDQVYLYISPQGGGRQGMACVSCSLVDGCGNPVRLLSCPLPSQLSASNLPSINEFMRMVETSVHQPSSSSWGPGPTALIQFRVWQRGSLDMRQLKDRLTGAVGHALCDIIMEFTLLTAPVCTTPRNLQDVKVLPVTSLPSSPVTVKKTFLSSHEEPERKPMLSRKLSDSVRISLKPVPQSASPFQALRETFSGRNKVGSPAPEFGQLFDWPHTQACTSDQPQITSTSSPSQSNPEGQELQELVAQYHRGDKGSLHQVFSMLMEPWLQFCYKRGMPTVSKVEMNVRSDFSLEYILKELKNALPAVGVKTPLKVFKVLHYAALDSTPFSMPFYPCRPQPWVLEKQLETAMDSVHAEVGSIKLMVVARDYNLWNITVSPESVDYQQSPSGPSLAELKGYQSSQKFPAKCCDQAKDKDGYETLPGVNQTFIPRQKLLVMFASSRKLQVYMYNYTGDLTAAVDKAVKRIVYWNNARSHLLSSLLFQKMGLFHHSTFSELSFTEEDNPYVQSTNDIDNLIKFVAPPHEVNRRHSSMTVQSRSISRVLNQYRPFDDTYKNLKPSKPMHKSVASTMRDYVALHGKQAQDIRARYRQDAERVMKLQQLYLNWWQKSSANPPVTEDYLDLLKQSSRLFHYCATPLLFCQQWRCCVIEQILSDKGVITSPPTLEKESAVAKSPTSSLLTAPSPSANRSRHSSGASITSQRAKGSEGQDTGQTKRTSDPSPAPPTHGTTDTSTSEPNPNESWHLDICQHFLTQYHSYLVSEFGFIAINLQPNISRKSDKPKKKAEDSSQHCLTFNLQKTLTSGIILMELSLRNKYFFLKMFVLDYLQLGISNHDMQLLFVDECEKYKDLIHVHSFAHDFHLRCINDYLRGNTSILPSGFHLSNFLSDFLQIYPIPPSFARNCLAKESADIRDLPCPGPQLFNYMRNQSGQFDMQVFHMRQSSCADLGDEYALVQIREPDKFKLNEDGVVQEDELDGYKVTLIISHDTARSPTCCDCENELLKLNFFVVLTRLKDFHPKRTLEKKFGDFRMGTTTSQCNTESSDASGVGAGEGDPGVPIAVKQHLGVRQEHINYLGYSNVHQARIYKVLNAQINAGREKIEEMVKMSKVKCRRDYLWQRMSAVKEDVKKKGKLPEESLETGMIPLNAAEFEELLELVCKQPLSEIDPQLALFFNMPPNWYSSLIPVLSAFFANSCRFFPSQQQHLHHTVILNSRWLDMFILLSVDQINGCMALSQVLRNPCGSEEDITEQEEQRKYISEQRRQSEPRKQNEQKGQEFRRQSEPKKQNNHRRPSEQGIVGNADQKGESMAGTALATELKYRLIEDFVNVCCFHLWSSIL